MWPSKVIIERNLSSSRKFLATRGIVKARSANVKSTERAFTVASRIVTGYGRSDNWYDHHVSSTDPPFA